MPDSGSNADRAADERRMPGRPVEDSVVLVTGAASGIGRATAVELGAQGARVFACDRDARGLDAVVASIESAGGRAAGCRLDVASKSEIDAAVRSALRQFGRVDGLVANAGVSSSQSFLGVTEQELDEVLAVNVKGVVFCGQAVVDGGWILNNDPPRK
jgi:NAD(P)-dependent dehydrogenase (short-subunit alcohol dehydrogenase family)